MIKEYNKMIHLTDIVEHVSKQKKLYKKQVDDVVRCVLDYIVESQIAGADIYLKGYMKLCFIPHKARYGHNITTGEKGISRDFYALKYLPCKEVRAKLKEFELSKEDIEILKNRK